VQYDLIKLLEKFNPRQGRVPVVDHITAEISKSACVRGILCEEIYKPVLWDRCVHELIRYGTHTFIEVGYGETLYKLIRWIDKDARVLNIKNKSSIETIKMKLATKYI
jgi:[acyl-carrier-protein] S-malonyltransferase